MISLENKKEWEGKILKNKNGEPFKILKYNGTFDVLVKFLNTGLEKSFRLSNIKIGSILDPMSPSVYGVGYFGVGKYTSRPDGGGPQFIYYKRWKGILQRCYDEKYSEYKNYGAKGIVICEEWKNFQNFAKWWHDNWKEYMDNTWELDKDILEKESKIYSPETCCFIPSVINIAFTKRNTLRGKYPIGVNKKGNSFIAQLNAGGKKIHLGSFKTPEEAFYKYKESKENYIRELANEYKDFITNKVYDALISYEVKIND